jgi:hypothetical protein
MNMAVSTPRAWCSKSFDLGEVWIASNLSPACGKPRCASAVSALGSAFLVVIDRRIIEVAMGTVKWFNPTIKADDGGADVICAHVGR